MGSNASKDEINEKCTAYQGLKGTVQVATQFASIISGINEGDDNGETLIFKVIRSGDAEAVTGMIQHGADPNVVSKKGLTPFHEAVLIGNRDMILAVLGAENLNVKATTKKEYNEKNVTVHEGSNVLHILAQRTEDPVVKLSQVLLCFVDEEEKDKNNNTPCDVAALVQHAQLASTLERCRRTWKERVKSARLAKEKAKERYRQAQEDMLTDQEKQQLRDNEKFLLGMKILPVMAELFSSLVLCAHDRQLIIADCQRDKKKAAEYILHDVILTGPYSHLQHFRQALVDVRQQHLAKFLPMRDEQTKL